jgi:hypothetical protein
MTAEMSEPEVMRELHEIRERHHEERKNWTPAQRREHYECVAEKAAQRGLRVVPHASHKAARKPGSLR